MRRANSRDKRSGGRNATAVDQHVGLRLRIRRSELGLSQSDLGGRLGVTFRQIQK